MTEKIKFEIVKRPWYEWALWVLWFFALLFFGQNAIASGAEMEARAATTFWITFFVFAIGGGVVWYLRRSKE